MKSVWECTWESYPGDGEQIKKYKSFEEAKKDIRQMISQIDISEYTLAIRKGANMSFRASVADFLEDYLSRPDFFSVEDTFPSCDPEEHILHISDEPLENDTEIDIDDDYDEEEKDKYEDFDIDISSDDLSFKYFDKAGLRLDTNMITMKDENADYKFEFYFENPNRISNRKTRELYIKLIPKIDLGTSSYPLLILNTLENSQESLGQKDIIDIIEYRYDMSIDRKAVGRNIDLLKAVGYDIRHEAEGYYLPKKEGVFSQEDRQIIVECIQANKELDNERKRELIGKLLQL